jgi:hypothetical protein
VNPRFFYNVGYRFFRMPCTAMRPGEVERRFGDHFAVRRIGGTPGSDPRRLIPGHAVYLMTRLVAGPGG